MSEQHDIERLQTIIEKIDLILEIVNESGGIVAALSDTKLKRPAILMHLVAMAEQFEKLKNDAAFTILSHFDREDLKGSYDIRNFIAHDYEGINLPIIEMVIRDKLPHIKLCAISALQISKNQPSI
ncbi:HepT-like ribonuclease domain-containing protein [uncultured Sulfuricurvum sp.]|uniref:HepT-like ribonuclease domain-containing protein n=1 Tax=uncultured Sulfuricurvum sp. TaxID=430693 RepID=UPI00260C888B|nr:HepT-like ribonuclease domain-containing protein [uncultured Sulfuricurvum sp.]